MSVSVPSGTRADYVEKGRNRLTFKTELTSQDGLFSYGLNVSSASMGYKLTDDKAYISADSKTGEFSGENKVCTFKFENFPFSESKKATFDLAYNLMYSSSNNDFESDIYSKLGSDKKMKFGLSAGGLFDDKE